MGKFGAVGLDEVKMGRLRPPNNPKTYQTIIVLITNYVPVSHSLTWHLFKFKCTQFMENTNAKWNLRLK